MFHRPDHFGFTNVGSEMYSFWVTAFWNFKLGSWPPCRQKTYKNYEALFQVRFHGLLQALEDWKIYTKLISTTFLAYLFVANGTAQKLLTTTTSTIEPTPRTACNRASTLSRKNCFNLFNFATTQNMHDFLKQIANTLLIAYSSSINFQLKRDLSKYNFVILWKVKTSKSCVFIFLWLFFR